MIGPLAQSVEQRTFNPWVVGSIPTGPTAQFGFRYSKCFALFQNLYRFTQPTDKRLSVNSVQLSSSMLTKLKSRAVPRSYVDKR